MNLEMGIFFNFFFWQFEEGKRLHKLIEMGDKIDVGVISHRYSGFIFLGGLLIINFFFLYHVA